MSHYCHLWPILATIALIKLFYWHDSIATMALIKSPVWDDYMALYHIYSKGLSWHAHGACIFLLLRNFFYKAVDHCTPITD